MIPLRETADVRKEAQQHCVAIVFCFLRNTTALSIEGIIFLYRARYDRNECNGEMTASLQKVHSFF